MRVVRAVPSGMVAGANLVEVAALVGDTARATMLAALMGGQSLTGSELAFLAGVSRSTASEHLAMADVGHPFWVNDCDTHPGSSGGPLFLKVGGALRQAASCLP